MKREMKASSRKRKVLLVDDHPVVRDGFSLTINAESDLEICGEAEDSSQALEAIKASKPDVLLVDVSLKGDSGLELTREIGQRYPDIPVLIVSMHEESIFAARALRAGAKGYIMKKERMDRILEGIRAVLRGEVFVSEAVKSDIMRSLFSGAQEKSHFPEDALTNREIQVFELLGQGRTTRAIAGVLHVSMRTIETHRENIKKKLKLANMVELHQKAFEWVQVRSSI